MKLSLLTWFRNLDAEASRLAASTDSTAEKVCTMDKGERLNAIMNRPLLIREGDQMIDGATATRILTGCRIDVQNKRDRGGELTVRRHLENMIRPGNWLPYSQIHFCRVASLDGSLIFVNGYHRLRALERFGSRVSFNVRIIDVADEVELGETYAMFDRIDRKRTRSLATHAVGLADLLGVSSFMATVVDGALDYICNGMRVVRLSDTDTLVDMSSQEKRTKMALAWADEAKLFDAILFGAHGCQRGLKAKLAKAPCAAVVLQTLKHVGPEAVAFWTAVAENNGLKKGTPQHTLVQAFFERQFSARDPRNLLLPAIAWNAFYEGRKLSVIKEGQMKTLAIYGTPIGKSRS